MSLGAPPPPRIRPPAVAGSFYPADPPTLRAALRSAFGDARSPGDAATLVRPKALIVPHAGYAYSGPVAASGYRTLSGSVAEGVRRVVLLGPSHRVPVAGLAVSTADAFLTPLGDVPVDAVARDELSALARCEESDRPHALEHSLEVQLPFLQSTLGQFSVVPLAVGGAEPGDVAEALELLWGGDETLVVVSTDLSHYLRYEDAVARDRRTAQAVMAGRGDLIRDDDACGARPLRGLLVAAARRGLAAVLLDLRNSGDTAGPRDRVVGYGAFAFA